MRVLVLALLVVVASGALLYPDGSPTVAWLEPLLTRSPIGMASAAVALVIAAVGIVTDHRCERSEDQRAEQIF